MDLQQRKTLVQAGKADLKDALQQMPNASVPLENAKCVAEKQRDLLEKLADGADKADRKASALKASAAKLIDQDNKIKAVDLKAHASRLRQAQFDQLLFHILGREDSLDRVRGISDEHREALLNYEAGTAQTRHTEEVNRLKQQLADAETQLQTKSDELTKALDTRMRACQEKADLVVELDTVKLQLSTTQHDLSETRAQLVVAKADASTAHSQLQGAERQIALINETASEANETFDSTIVELRTTKTAFAAKQGELVTSQTELTKSKAAVDEANKQLDEARGDLSRREAVISAFDNERRWRDEQLTAEQTKTSSREKELDKVKGDIEAHHNGLAAFFAGYVGFDLSEAGYTAVMQSWVSTIASVEWIAGGSADERPWTLLPAWYGENLAPLPELPRSLLRLVLRFYAATAQEQFSRESSGILRHLTDVLAHAPALPAALVVDAVEQAIDSFEAEHSPFRHSRESQLFNLGLRQLLHLLQRRWPSPRVVQLLARTRSLVEQSFACMKDMESALADDNGATLLRRFADSRDAEGELPDYEGPLFTSGRIGLLSAAQDHVWSFDLDTRTVRLIHSARGEMVDTEHYVFRSSESAGGSPNLSFTLAVDGDYFWFMTEWNRAIIVRGEHLLRYISVDDSP
ncbi:hypothetical protein PG999_010471 [Apiospora kogelbergensis]|uniref:Uncharacterized protein n=1 Tax=Apiospora kogelbergensis TaxID=1337665 RepID=A0AAW0QBS8_9PEZI